MSDGKLGTSPGPKRGRQPRRGRSIITDPNDNLILRAILDRARRSLEARKVMLTENARDFDAGEVQTALTAAGVERSFRSAAHLLGWLGSISG